MKNVLDKNMFFAKFKNVILAQFGEEEGNSLWENAGKISADLLTGHPKAVPDAKNVAYPMAGIYLALQEKVPKEEALKLMMDYAPSAGEDVKRKLQKLTGIRGVRYHRQKSVAEGDEYCDYYITRE